MPTKVKTKKAAVKKVKEEAIPTRYTADIFLVREPIAKNERIAEVSWIAEGNKLSLGIHNVAFSADLEHFVKYNIVTAEGRTYSPGLQPKEWVLNLCKVPEGLLGQKFWTVSEARASYEN